MTRDDLKGLRRWTLVAGIWAVAATAVALIALLDTSGGDAERKAGDAGQRVGAVEKRVDALDRDVREVQGLSERIGDAESRIGGLAPLTDVTKLQTRVGRAEEDASAANNRSGNVRKSVQDLEDRVTQLEQAPAPSRGGDAAEDSGDARP